MELMIIHNILPFIIAFVGIFGGVYVLKKSNKMTHDWVLHLNFIALGVLDLYVGFVYLGTFLDIISPLPSSELSLYLRSANLLLVSIPLMISWRMGL